MKCPICRGDLVADPKHPGKVLCYNCRKRFDGAAVQRASMPERMEKAVQPEIRLPRYPDGYQVSSGIGNEHVGERSNDAEDDEFESVPEGNYICTLERLGMGVSRNGNPMVKGSFRIVEGEYERWCVFVNMVCKPGYPLHKTMEFLRSLNVLDESRVHSNGDYRNLAALLVDIVDASAGMLFEVRRYEDKGYSRVEVVRSFRMPAQQPVALYQPATIQNAQFAPVYAEPKTQMRCPRCSSDNISVQVVNQTELKKKHSIVYWVFIGWWLNPILWIFMTLPMLVIHLFKPKNYKAVNSTKSVHVCNNCGHTW